MDHRVDAANREAEAGFTVCLGCSFENFKRYSHCTLCGEALPIEGDEDSEAKPVSKDDIPLLPMKLTQRQIRARYASYCSLQKLYAFLFVNTRLMKKMSEQKAQGVGSQARRRRQRVLVPSLHEPRHRVSVPGLRGSVQRAGRANVRRSRGPNRTDVHGRSSVSSVVGFVFVVFFFVCVLRQR